LFHCHCHVSSQSKTPKQVFFLTYINIFDIFLPFTTLYLHYYKKYYFFFILTFKIIFTGNNCDLLTITSFACDPEALRARKGVVVSARVHPGESNASHMMKGVIDYLTGPSLDAKILRYVQN